jgi:hypothetical protein
MHSQSHAESVCVCVCVCVVFGSLSDYVRGNRTTLRFNYDLSGTPRLRLRPCDGRLSEALSGPDDPTRPGEAHNRAASARSISLLPASSGSDRLQTSSDRFLFQARSRRRCSDLARSRTSALMDVLRCHFSDAYSCMRIGRWCV